MRLNNYCLNRSMETIFMNQKNSKINKPHKFPLKIFQRLLLSSSNKHIALKSVSICYKWKDGRKQKKSNNLKLIAPKWNDEFELKNSSNYVSDYNEYIIKNMKY